MKKTLIIDSPSADYNTNQDLLNALDVIIEYQKPKASEAPTK